MLTPKREETFKRVVEKRQPNLTVILENVHDHHNIGAVLRSCDSVGIMEIYVLYTETHLGKDHLTLGKRSSSGARRWVDVRFYKDMKACFEAIRAKYDYIFATHISEEAKSLYDLDLTQSTALLFGNEHSVISEEAMAYTDGNFIIPQVGMTQSINISVACAVSIYEAYRQREAKGFYGDSSPLDAQQQSDLFELYKERHINRVKMNTIPRIK